LEEHKGWIDTYRPKELSEVIGQERTIKEITKRIKEKKLRQNTLFSGSTGVGKSTIARIIAKTINCKDLKDLKPCHTCSVCRTIDDEESSNIFKYFDGSSLNKEKLNNLKEICNTPSLVAKKKIIFIDEIQNIASGRDSSLQVLLKLIEKDYKGKVYFIMSTMDVKKINKAVVDRFQMHFKLKPVNVQSLMLHGMEILKKENMFETVPDSFLDAQKTLAFSCKGSVRHFVKDLETCVYRELWTEEDIVDELEIMSEKQVHEILKALVDKDPLFFTMIKKFEGGLESFFKESYTILSELFVFVKSGFISNNYLTKTMSALKPNFDPALLISYNDIHSNMGVYFKKEFFISKLAEYFETTTIPNSSPVTESIESSSSIELEDSSPKRRKRRKRS